MLLHQIAVRGRATPYPYHVYGTQALAWVRKGLDGFDAQREFLEGAIEVVMEGARNHPTADRIRSILKGLEDEKLALVLR